MKISNLSKKTSYDYSESLSLVQTVKDNMEKYTKREVRDAERARALCRNIGSPSQAEFEHILKENFVRNCPLTVEDAKRALDIWGPEIYYLKGKTVKKKCRHVPKFVLINMESSILEGYENDTIFIDNFYVNGNVFFHTITRRMRFRTVSYVTKRKKYTLEGEIDALLNFYATKE